MVETVFYNTANPKTMFPQWCCFCLRQKLCRDLAWKYNFL